MSATLILTYFINFVSVPTRVLMFQRPVHQHHRHQIVIVINYWSQMIRVASERSKCFSTLTIRYRVLGALETRKLIPSSKRSNIEIYEFYSTKPIKLMKRNLETKLNQMFSLDYISNHISSIFLFVWSRRAIRTISASIFLVLMASFWFLSLSNDD